MVIEAVPVLARRSILFLPLSLSRSLSLIPGTGRPTLPLPGPLHRCNQQRSQAAKVSARRLGLGDFPTPAVAMPTIPTGFFFGPWLSDWRRGPGNTKGKGPRKLGMMSVTEHIAGDDEGSRPHRHTK
ncbi:hypothetical protein LX36DRAFT_354032 [Colletotrichum falcatum]|nr:hypothetical protein LX36DRAFT_354032 [Colletotrichum falcatum]